VDKTLGYNFLALTKLWNTILAWERKAGGSKFGMKKVCGTILGFLAFGKNQQGVGIICKP